jgi:hypothetical protein
MSGTARPVPESTVDQAPQRELYEEQAKVITDLETLRAAIAEGHDDLDDLDDYLDFLGEANGVIGGDYTISAGSATTLTGAGHIRYRIGGQIFYTDLDTTITLADDGDVDDGLWRAWRIEISRTGVVTALADGDTQHATEEDALLSLSGLARTANTATIGYFAIHSNGGFNIGTDDVDGETAANVYHVRGVGKQVTGLHAALSAPLAVGSSATNFSHGTVDGKRNGLFLTQIAAGTNVAFDDVDTITNTGEFGAHLIVVGLDGASIYALAADGVAGEESAMTYATAALALAALDTLVDRLPELFVPIGSIVVEALKDDFTYGTDDIAGTDGTATYRSATVGTWSRTALTGFGSHQVNPPAVPALPAESVASADDLVAANLSAWRD